MQDLQVLLVEDDPSAALDVEMLLDEMGLKLAAVMENAEDALQYIYKEQPDLVILDVELKGELTGLDIAKEISHLCIPTIFTTSHKDIESFEASKHAYSFGYLVKPFDRLSLQSLIEQALKSLFPEGELLEEPIGSAAPHDVKVLPGTVLVKHVNAFYPIRFDEILFIQGEGNYSTIYTETRKFMLKLSLRRLLDYIPPNDFAPIHRSFIVRLDKVESIDLSSGKLTVGKEVLPVGRNFRAVFLDRFNILK